MTEERKNPQSENKKKNGLSEGSKKGRLSVKEIALMGMMLATIEAVKLTLAVIPGVELVTLLLIVYTLFFEKKMLYLMPAFLFIEGVIYGFGIWWFMYAYIWPLLILLTYLFRRQQSVWFWSVFSGFFGLLFGALCSLVYLFAGGVKTAFAWWISGIPTDICHGISNFVLCAVLFVPLRAALKKMKWNV